MVSFGGNKPKRSDQQSLLGSSNARSGGIFRNHIINNSNKKKTERSDDLPLDNEVYNQHHHHWNNAAGSDCDGGKTRIHVLGLLNNNNNNDNLTTPTKKPSSLTPLPSSGADAGAGGGGRYVTASAAANAAGGGTPKTPPMSPESSDGSPARQDDEDDLSDLTGAPGTTGDTNSNHSSSGDDGPNGILGDPPGRVMDNNNSDSDSGIAQQRNLLAGDDPLEPLGGGSRGGASGLVHNFFCMMDKACVAPAKPVDPSPTTTVTALGELQEKQQVQGGGVQQQQSFVDMLEGAIMPVPDEKNAGAAAMDQQLPAAEALSIPTAGATTTELLLSPLTTWATTGSGSKEEEKQEPNATTTARSRSPSPAPASSGNAPPQQSAPATNSYTSPTTSMHQQRPKQPQQHSPPVKHENFEMILQEREETIQPNNSKKRIMPKLNKFIPKLNALLHNKRKDHNHSSRGRSPAPQSTKERQQSSSSNKQYRRRHKEEDEEEKKEEINPGGDVGGVESAPSYSRGHDGQPNDKAARNGNSNRALHSPPLTSPVVRGVSRGSGSGASSKAQKEARYKNLLNAFKSMNHRTPLETVHEAADESSWKSDMKNNNNEATELKVRVPGLVHPDAFISDKDLIGEEIGSQLSGCSPAREYDNSGEEEKEQLLNRVSGIVKDLFNVTDTTTAEEKDGAEEQTAALHLPSQRPTAAARKDLKKGLAATADNSNNGAAGTTTAAAATKNNKKKSRPKEVDQISDSPTSSPIRRSQTWIEKLRFHRSYEEPSDNENGGGANSKTGTSRKSRSGAKSAAIAMNRQRSAPEKLLVKDPSSSPPSAKKSPAPNPHRKPLWKAAVCPETGRTYYFHRLTRQTTWTKPSDEELFGRGEKDGGGKYDNENEVEKTAPESSSSDEAPRKKTPRDFDPSVWEKKQEILHILKTMSPPDGESVDRLMAQYDGREMELLAQLKDLAESQPFDEPMTKGAGSRTKPESEPTEYVGPLATIVEDPTLAGSSMNTLKSRVRTQTSLKSGFTGVSSGLMSASTRQIKNTARGRMRDTIPETESHATSISSKLGYMLPPVASTNMKGQNGSPTRVPSNIPVPRVRELVVEDYSSERYQVETFGMNGPLNRSNKKTTEKTDTPPLYVPDNTNYFGDNEDTDTKDTDTNSIPNDSISALSEADLSYTAHDRKFGYEQARRRALDEAIAREDWDLAAALSEGMRSLKAKDAHGGERNHEWTQTELDRFISENDWDAVANYIAHVREEAKNGKGESETSSGKKGGSYRLEKRFGARSQLQHKKLNYEEDSWESSRSESSSDSCSSVSSYSEEPYRQKKLNFAC